MRHFFWYFFSNDIVPTAHIWARDFIFYNKTIVHLLYGECLSQLHILNSTHINKFLDHKKERTKSFPEVIRYKETTPRKLQQHKYTIILWHFPWDCDLKCLYKHLSKLHAERRKTGKRVIFTCLGKQEDISIR